MIKRILIVFLFWCSPLSATTLIIQTGTNGTEYECALSSISPNTNNDHSIGMGYGGYGSDTLIIFDLSLLPPGATITSVDCFIYMSAAVGGTNYVLRRILPANNLWDFAAATWNTQDGSNVWAGGSNGCGIEGADYSASFLGSQPYISFCYYDFPLNVTEFNNMVASNYGMLFYQEAGTYSTWKSSADPTVADRPKLVIQYSAPDTATITQTFTDTPTPSITATRTQTLTITPTATVTATNTPRITNTSTATATPTPCPNLPHRINLRRNIRRGW
jgi:hypothetical protein